MERQVIRHCVCVLLLSIWPAGLGLRSAQAVIINSADGAGNTTAPTSWGNTLPYWDSIGQVGGGSGIYLGGSYVLTVNHVHQLDNPSVAIFGGQTYNIRANSWLQLTNPGGGHADLARFEIDGTLSSPGVTAASIVDSTLNSSAKAWLMGYGRNRSASESYWLINTGANPYTWSPGTSSNYDASGYTWAPGNTKRWGTNTLDASGAMINTGYGITNCYASTFDSNGGANEGQVAVGDSGGAAFVYRGGQWMLAGVNVARSTISGQPNESSVFSNLSYVADISIYKDQLFRLIADANGDGIVDVLDLGILATHWQASGVGWAQGDFNGDGVVDVLDLGILASHWQATAGSFSDAVAAAFSVPEPAALSVLVAGLVCILWRRRRHRG